MTAPILTAMRRQVESPYLEIVASRARNHLKRGVRSTVKGQLWERIAEGKRA